MGIFEALKNTTREDEVKALFLTELNIPLDMRYSIDCYTRNVLFEFKYEADVKKSVVLAQALYYLNTLFINGECIPIYVALINKKEVVIYETKTLKSIYEDSSIFILGSPSGPCQESITKASAVTNILYFYSELDEEEDLVVSINSLKDLLRSKKIIKDNIKITNVKRAYQGYVRQLGEYILEHSSSNGIYEFRADAIGKATIISETTTGNYIMDFQFDNGAKRFENISKVAYDSYWKQWNRIESEEEAKEVFKTIYDLLGICDRRTKGQFYTPKHLAEEAWKRIIAELGNDFWEDGTWRIWDCCAGTGNLEYDVLPESCMQYMYLSTLDIEEVDQLKQNFPVNRKIFQYNFLNDHNNKLPRNLKEDMANPNIKWLFLINPPYVEAQGETSVQSGTTQSNIQDIMKFEQLGNSAREMFSQFLYRIEKDFKNNYFLGLFCEVKLIVSSKFEAFRKFWKPLFKGGFVCNATEHFQCKGAKQWPIIFSLFDRRGRNDVDIWSDYWEGLNLSYDVIDKQNNIIGEKRFRVYNKVTNFRNVFPENSKNLIKRIPLVSSGIQKSTGNIYMPPYAPSDFLASMSFISSDFQQQNRCYIVSGIVNTNHNTIFITKENYKDVLTAFALYKAPNFTWLTNKDSFKIYNRELSLEEQWDCILYSLVCSSNQTATYKFDSGEIITNELNPLNFDLFDFSRCSELGKNVFNKLKEYLELQVNYKNLNTTFGKGRFMGLYQYQMEPKNNIKDCFNIKFDNEFKKLIEELRKRVETLSLELCF